MVIKSNILRVVSAVAALALIAVLAWLTMADQDPCANPQVDVSGSVLADTESDQDGLINRAIIMKGNCSKE